MNAALNYLASRVRNMIARGIVRLVDDTTTLQTLQCALLGDELRAGLERFQQYGYTSVPLDGAEAVAMFVGGDRSHGIVIAVEDRRYRLKGLQGGEVALYDDLGQRVVLTRDGILVQAPAILFDAEMSRFTGDVQVDGSLHSDEDISADGDVSDGVGSMQDMRDIFNSHGHAISGGSSAPGPTGAPNASM